ncbi:hypothetical protein ACI2IX_10360 [Leifsonia aquatica]|uniref:hypothetical protein n=1 Tax=Leifsonia aquatica TaxID=144185 RepID=UPI00384F8425
MTRADPAAADAVSAFLDYYAQQRPEEARFARLLLDDGGRVVSAWGPEQMAVWHLEVQRGDMLVMFHSERGYAEWPRVVRSAVHRPHWDEYRPIGLGVFAWARAHGVPFRLDDPDDVDHDLVAHGRDALDWLDRGGDAPLQRVYQAWLGDRLTRGAGDASRPRSHAVAAMEAAAAVEHLET